MKRKPERLSASRKEAVLRIEWEDGHKSEYPFGTLRAACPCADCRVNLDQGAEKEEMLELTFLNGNTTILEAIERVGNYAVQLAWRDGHRAGIYTWDYLFQLCPCSDHGDGRSSV
ncbi:MAG: DUF971 domain-containing protein [Anaerolineales bacterium]|nr:DUF971 domain-containing protein [Anaerolineales bacterium]MCK5635239.1 DUF971 domain-containing protein [Anaerolineales bacterium]